MRMRVFILILSCLCVASCMKLERQPLEKRLYALETVRPSVAAQAAQGEPACREAVLVRRLAVSPRAAGRELVYRTGESVWGEDYYNLFFVAPADMLTQDLRAWLASARLFAEVLDPGSLAPSGYILEGNVTALYGDFAPDVGMGAGKGAGQPQAVAEMQFLLLKNGDERQMVLSRGYRKTVPLASNTPQDLVRALREATAQIYTDLEADLRAAIARK
jgi:cholesterol transport system auxiliary component